MKKKISPYHIFILGFLALILLGTLLLLLPLATVDGYRLSFVDALFTSTSAVCITGLLSVPTITGVYTLFGKIVIICLVEIGGLGFITIATFIVSLFKQKIDFNDRVLIKESLNQNSLKGMVKLVRITMYIALLVQFIGAILSFLVFIKDYDFWEAVGMGFFHAISAFNNAGFDLLPFGNSYYVYRGDVLFNVVTMCLIIIGGLGFIVIYDVITKKNWHKLSIHSKIVIKTSLLLIVFGTFFFKILEGKNITFLQALFNSVAARTAGFATIDMNTLSSASLIIMMILMYIGASPASTGGGIKTTTFYIVAKHIISFARGKEPLTYKRKIADNSIIKAYILIIVSAFVIVVSTMAISIIEAAHKDNARDFGYLVKILFEVISAFGTVGDSMGITASLEPFSKFIIACVMFFGRLGPITIISVWNNHWFLSNNNRVKYIEEKIIIG